MDRSSSIPRPKSRLPLPASSFNRSLKSSPSRERLNADSGIDVRRLHRPSQENLRRQPSNLLFSDLAERLDEAHDELEQSSAGGWISEPRGSFPIDENESSDQHASYHSDRSTFDIPYRSSPYTRSSRSTSRSSLYSRTASIYDPPIDSPVLSNPDRWSVTGPTSPASLNPNRLSVGQGPSYPSSTSPTSRKNPPFSPQSSSAINVKQKRFTVSGPPSWSQKTGRSPMGGVLSASKKPRPEASSPTRKSSISTAENAHDDEDASLSPTAAPQTAPSKSRPAPRKAEQSTSRKPPKPAAAPKKKVVSKPPPVSCAIGTAGATQVPHNPAKSSNALRESIAKAKAAARQAAKRNKSQTHEFDRPDAPLHANDHGGFNPPTAPDMVDPFNQGPKGSEAQKLVLKKKAKQGRATGILNIAALGLTEMPEEIMRMYDFNPDDDDSGGGWAESVDLVKLIAADNEFEMLSESVFPDVDPLAAMENDDIEGNFQFFGLETIDLHGNRLGQLPPGFRRLERLRLLNLSKNNLPMEIFNLIAQLPNLAELRMASNGLSGTLPSSVGDLRQLEILDLKGNDITTLCDEITSLTSLSVLDVSDNKLSSLPSAIFTNVPLIELNAKNNKLCGDLIPSSVTSIPRLRILTLTGNSLTGLSGSTELALPSIKQLHMGGNRVDALPDVSSWGQLLTLVAENNRLTQLPEGFTQLSQVKIADFTGNEIRHVPVEIGLMDSLTSFKLANNPLTEKRLLGMDTEKMKLLMRAKLEPPPKYEDSDDESVQTFFTLPDDSATPKVALHLKTGGLLDLSNQDLDEVSIARIEDLARSADIRTVQLSKASLQALPVSVLSAVAHSVVDLDLSHNLLTSQELSSSMLFMSSLKTLNLSHSGLTSVENLLSKVSAPCLETLDLSSNRLTGKLPMFREIFPSLQHLLVADNRFDSIDYESVEGLRTLDVSNNDIKFLPPRIGLLSGEGGLQRFMVAGNTFRVPRWQVVEKGTIAILEWLKRAIPEEQLKEWIGQVSVNKDT